MASRPSQLPDLDKEPPDIVTCLIKKPEIPNLQLLLSDGLFVHTTDTGIVFSGIIVNFALHWGRNRHMDRRKCIRRHI